MTNEEHEKYEFQLIFRGLVQVFQPRALERGTVDAYAAALSEWPIEVLRESAKRLAVTRKFFPSTGEWAAEARTVLRHYDRPPLCPRCGNFGLLRVEYSSGESFDLAVCSCRHGDWYRRVGEPFVRQRFNLAADQQVTDIEITDALAD